MFSKWKNKYTKNISIFSKMPLAQKITAWYTLFLFLMLLLLSTFIVQFTHTWEETELRNNLQTAVIKIADNPRTFKSFNEGVFAVLYTPNGIIARGAVPDGFPLESTPSPHRITEITVQNSMYYYYDAPVHNPAFDGWVRGIVPVTAVSHRTNTMLMALLFGGLAFLIIGSYGGFLLISRGLRPIRTITHTAADIGRSKDLSKRIPEVVKTSDEISQLTNTFNGMLTVLEESSIRERQFSADVSHELRTPISVIQAESDYSRNYTQTLDEAKESFTHIFKQSKFMTSIISQLLDVARLDSMKELPMSPFCLSDMLNESIPDYVTLGNTKNIAVTYDIEDNIKINGNRTLLQRAIGNLLDNALKFTKDQIHVTLKRENKFATITITDNGAGIEKENLSKIWDRLYQTESSRNKKENHGLGLGLYFVNNVVRLHNGIGSVTSTQNVETNFIIKLPI